MNELPVFPSQNDVFSDKAFARSGRVIWSIVGLLTLIQIVRSFLNPFEDFHLLASLAFVPAQFTAAFDADGVWKEIAQTLRQTPEMGPALAVLIGNNPRWWTPLTYSLLHGDFSHLAMNSIWLLAFGVAVARRFGAPLFLLFFLFSALCGAIIQYIAHPLGLAPVIGASAAVSGAMGAAVRFAFAPGAPLGASYALSRDITAYRRPAPPLSVLLHERRALVFIALWFATNFVFGVLAPALNPASASIAWQAHIGGFLAGFFGFSLFDRLALRQARDDLAC